MNEQLLNIYIFLIGSNKILSIKMASIYSGKHIEIFLSYCTDFALHIIECQVATTNSGLFVSCSTCSLIISVHVDRRFPWAEQIDRVSSAHWHWTIRFLWPSIVLLVLAVRRLVIPFAKSYYFLPIPARPPKFRLLPAMQERFKETVPCKCNLWT